MLLFSMSACLLLAALEAICGAPIARPQNDDQRPGQGRTGTQDSDWDDRRVRRYLQTFGFLPEETTIRKTGRSLDELSGEEVSEALKDLQYSLGLPETGRMDGDLSAAMTAPRCGVKFNPAAEGRPLGRRGRSAADQNQTSGQDQSAAGGTRDYFVNPRFATYNITYYIQSLLPLFPAEYATRGQFTAPEPRNFRLSADVQKELIAYAFTLWATAVPFAFRRVASPPAHITIAAHGAPPLYPLLGQDETQYDGEIGPGSDIIAHATLPDSRHGYIHMGLDWEWTLWHEKTATTPYTLIAYWQVMTHEIGHTLGLSHINLNEAVMYPNYHERRADYSLSAADRQQIQVLYGTY